MGCLKDLRGVPKSEVASNGLHAKFGQNLPKLPESNPRLLETGSNACWGLLGCPKDLRGVPKSEVASNGLHAKVGQNLSKLPESNLRLLETGSNAC